MTSFSLIAGETQTFDQASAGLARCSLDSQRAIADQWKRERQARIDEYDCALAPQREAVAVLTRQLFSRLGACDTELGELLHERSRLASLSAASHGLSYSGRLPQSLTKQLPLLEEYQRLLGNSHLPAAESDVLPAELMRQVQGLLGGELERRAAALDISRARMIERFGELKDLSAFDELLVLDGEHSAGKAIGRKLRDGLDSLIEHLEHLPHGQDAQWDAALAVLLGQAGEIFEQLKAAIASGQIPLAPRFLQAGVRAIHYPEQEQVPDLRKTIPGKVYLAVARHLDALGLEDEILLSELDASRSHETEFVRTAIRERDRLLREIVVESTAAAVLRQVSGLLSLPEQRGMLKDFSLLLTQAEGALEDTAVVLAIEYGLPDQIAYRAARSRFLSGGIDGLGEVLQRHVAQQPLFERIIHRFPEILTGDDAQIDGYLSRLSETRAQLALISPILSAYYSSVRDVHESTTSLQAQADTVALWVQDRELLRREEQQALLELCESAIEGAQPGSWSSEQVRIASEVLVFGFTSAGQITGSSRSIESIRRAIERAGLESLSNPLLDELVRTVLEGPFLVCTSRPHVKPGDKSYRFSSPDTDSEPPILEQIRTFYQPDKSVALSNGESSDRSEDPHDSSAFNRIAAAGDVVEVESVREVR